jgi:hypothetical protein
VDQWTESFIEPKDLTEFVSDSKERLTVTAELAGEVATTARAGE